jgi:hypothetical protein
VVLLIAIIAAFDAEITNPTHPNTLAAFNNGLKPITYNAQRQLLITQKLMELGVSQYTPEKYEKVYVSKTQEEINTYLLQMDHALTNNNSVNYIDAQAALADLIIEMNADINARQGDHQKAFGVRATFDQAQAALKKMTDILVAASSAAKSKPAPKPKQTKQGYTFNPVLFTKTTGDLDSIDDGLSIINAKIKKYTNNNTWNPSNGLPTELAKLNTQQQTLIGAEARFEKYKSKYDELSVNILSESDAQKRRDMSTQQRDIHREVVAMQNRVAKIMEEMLDP